MGKQNFADKDLVMLQRKKKKERKIEKGLFKKSCKKKAS